MTDVRALVVHEASGPFSTETIERRELRDDDVAIDIAFAGICHSDIHTVRAEWGQPTLPLVPGHEIAGTVKAVGDAVTKVKVGDRVGVGCMVDSCGECDFCKDGLEQFCAKGAVLTYNAKNYDGEQAQGGYSQGIVVSERFVVTIPDGIDLDEAAPLLCAGITTYSPLKRWGAGPGTKVAVVGIGGLGHMGVKIAKAMGAEVHALSRSRNKEERAKELGADFYHATGEDGALEELAGTFDIVLNTVSADLPMDDYIGTVRPTGVMVNVGIAPGHYEFAANDVMGNKAVAGSNIGGIGETQEMLDFCAEHNIAATIETLEAKPDKVGEAYDRVVDGDVHYRAVIDMSTI